MGKTPKKSKRTLKEIIEEKYGPDFGSDSAEKSAAYLKEIGLDALAELLHPTDRFQTAQSSIPKDKKQVP